MKKFIKSKKMRIAIVSLLVCIVLAGSIRLMFTRVIRSPAFFSGRHIEFKLVTTLYRPHTTPTVLFKSGKSLEQIKKAILKWDPEARIEIQENNMFISSYNPETDKRDYYYIYKSDPLNEKYYRILDLGTRYSEDENKSDSYQLNFIVPYYLFCEVNGINPHSYDHGDGQKYEMIAGSTIEDVYGFYKESGYYEVMREDNKVILTETFFKNPDNAELMQVDYEIDCPVVIEITTEGEKSFFSCTIDNDKFSELDKSNPIVN